MLKFEILLNKHRGAIERFVRFKISDPFDADDILQETYISAATHLETLQNEESFKAWILSIARNKCNDHFRKRSEILEIPLDALSEKELIASRHGVSQIPAVRDTLALLGDRHKQILYLYFWKEMPQEDIAKTLNIPLGTVKSRLHAAKQKFKSHYPYPPKGDIMMKKMPKILPAYTIQRSEKEPFSVKWEELPGWFIIPREGEKLTWSMYDMPSRECSHVYDMQVIGKAAVHGIEGVELTARESSCSDKKDPLLRTFIAQLTDTHCRYLAAIRTKGDIRHYITFLDGDEFMDIWGIGENNCGNETNLSPKGILTRNGSEITCPTDREVLDIAGRYTLTIGDKVFDTVCVMDIFPPENGILIEQYLDQNGRTILWRRFNRDNWAFDRYGETWSKKLPENERITVNGETYVHFYDCITEYIL